MKKIFFKNQKGFTLIELLTAMGIFLIVVGIIVNIFIFAIRQQRIILVNQFILDQTSYILEYMGRALRMAAKDFEGDCIDENLNYEETRQGRGIKFINTLYDNECQEFYLQEDKIIYDNGDVSLPLSSNKLEITELKFNITGQDENDNIQPSVVIYMKIKSKNTREEQEIKIQTLISQRNRDLHY